MRQQHTSVDAFIEALYQHAEEASRIPTNLLYTERVQRNAGNIQTLINNQSGEVCGVVVAWREKVRPLADMILSDPDLTNLSLAEPGEYQPTVFDGILGRTRLVSMDEIMGPMIALDLVAEETLTSQEAV